MNIPTRKSQPVAVVETPSAYLDTIPSNKSELQSKVDSINSLLEEAYKKASALELTKEEAEALVAPFPDSDFYRGAAGNQDLIYIQHHSLRLRLNKVIGVGRWSMIIRRQWAEDFLTAKKEQACRVYVEAVLIVRGCYVGESIGDGTYYKSNAGGNMGDAYESAKSVALRRVCKEFGMGLQAWDKGFCEEWKRKYPGFNRP
jgi:Mitochondrial genome maintenance MGM101